MASKIPHPKRAPIRAKNYRSNRRTCVRSVRNGISALLRTDFSTYAACCQLILTCYMQFQAKKLGAGKSDVYHMRTAPLCNAERTCDRLARLAHTKKRATTLLGKTANRLMFSPEGAHSATLRPLVKAQNLEGFSLAVTHNVAVGMTPVTLHAQPPVLAENNGVYTNLRR